MYIKGRSEVTLNKIIGWRRAVLVFKLSENIMFVTWNDWLNIIISFISTYKHDSFWQFEDHYSCSKNHGDFVGVKSQMLSYLLTPALTLKG